MPPPPKTEAPPPAAPPAKAEKATPAPEAPGAAAAPAPAPVSGIRAWLPALVCVVAAPAATWVVANYVLMPQLEKKLSLPAVDPAAESMPEVALDENGKPKAPANYKFEGVVVNLAGTMGTRYLKTSIIVMPDPKSKVDIAKVFDENHTKLYDATIAVLSSLTLSDLEEAGAKNIVKAKLIGAYNMVLKSKVADQVYFAEFVVQ